MAGRHLVGDGARDDHEVGLAGAGRQRDDAEAHHVVAGRPERRTHLDGAAGQAPLVHPQAVGPTHVEQRREWFGQTPFVNETPCGYTQRRTPLRHAYTRPRSRTKTKIAHLDQAEACVALELGGPGEHEHGFHVEHHEQQGEDVVADLALRPAVAHRVRRRSRRPCSSRREGLLGRSRAEIPSSRPASTRAMAANHTTVR